jgi:uncharacterized membrane protein
VPEALLVAATISSGLLAGVFLLYAHTVMPALARTSDAEFVRTFARLDRHIVNPVFLVSSFLGAPLLSAAAAVAYWDEQPCGWILGALGAHALMVVITGSENLPRNDGLKAADLLTTTDPAKTRAAFDEAGWVRWNWVRVLLSAGALGLLAVALLHA